MAFSYKNIISSNESPESLFRRELTFLSIFIKLRFKLSSKQIKTTWNDACEKTLSTGTLVPGETKKYCEATDNLGKVGPNSS